MSKLSEQELPPQSTLEVGLSDPSGDIDISLIEYNRSLTFAERIRQNDRALDMARAFRKAGKIILEGQQDRSSKTSE